ncbi:MAG: condensation domain-containing protein, partial [Gammaproteobacteria bacterium]
MRRFAESPELRAEEDYWARVENAEATPLPTKDDGGARLHGGAEAVHAALSPEDTAELLGPVHRAFGTEIMDLLLTALGRALKGWSGGEAARVTLEGHGREPPDETLDLTRTVGWFTSLYPFLLSVPGDDIGEQIRRVKTALREVPRKGFGYGILRYAAGRKASPGPVPQLSFNYLGQFEDGGEQGMFGFSDEASGRAVSPHLSRSHQLDIVGLVAGGRLLLSLEFEPRTLARETAAALLDDMARQLGEVLRYCRALAERGEAAASLPADAPAAWAHLLVDGDIEDAYPLSPLQEGFLFQSLLDPDAESYFVQVRFHFAGTLDLDAFRAAWFALCRRHAVLRSAFVHRDLARPLQV